MDQRHFFLTSARLGFDVWTESDLPLALGLWGDPAVTRLTGGPFTASQVEARLAGEIANQKRLGLQYWPLYLLETGEHVGCCGLRPHGATEGVRELGFQLRASMWGKGFACEAAQTVIGHAFSHLNLNGLLAGHHPQNDRSRRVLAKLGFQYSHDEFYPPTGLLEPCYSLIRERLPSQLPRRNGANKPV